MPPPVIGADAAAVQAEAPVRARHLDRDSAMFAGAPRAGLSALLDGGAAVPAEMIWRGHRTPLAQLGIASHALAFVRGEANHVAGEPVSEEARAALLAVVVEAIGNKYFEVERRILSRQLVQQRLPQRRVADKISAVVLASCFEPIGAGRHRDQPLRFAVAVKPAANADLVAAHRLAAQRPPQVRLHAGRTGSVR